MSFLALVTAVSGLACSSSTRNLTSALPNLSPFSSRYILKPSTMSLPTWAKIPVVGATKPMRNSSVVAADVRPSAMAPASSNGLSRRSSVPVMISLPRCRVLLPLTSCRRCQFPLLAIARYAAPWTQPFGNADQPGRQKKDREHIDPAQYVLPPRHHGAQPFAQEKHDAGADHAADQCSRTAEDRHQQRVDRGRQLGIDGADDTRGVRPQHAGEAAEGPGDDEGEIFVQPRIVAEDLHAQLALADADQAAPEWRANQREHDQQRNRKQAEHQVEKRHLVGEVDNKLGALAQIDAVVAAGQRVPAIGQAPHALSQRQGDHEEIYAGGADGEKAEQGGEARPEQDAEQDDQPEIPSEAELILGRQDCRRIGADGQVGRLAEGREPGIAEQNVEAHDQRS